jgi:hypothetical protein
MTVQQFITSQSSIHGVESTSRSTDLEKVFVKSDATNMLPACAFIDLVLKQPHASGSIPPELILESFNPPRRGDTPCTISANFQSHASILANLGNPQVDEQAAHPTWRQRTLPLPTKHNVNMACDLTSDFPNLPIQTNQNQKTQQESQVSQENP